MYLSSGSSLCFLIGATVIRQLKSFAQYMEKQIGALYLAGRDSRTPIAAKCLIVIVVAYALSPIDLIPDFIPVLGYIDDLILLPLGIYVSIKLIPNHLWREFQRQAEQRRLNLPKNKKAAVMIGVIWGVVIAIALYALWQVYRG